jgi:hypothetical protein
VAIKDDIEDRIADLILADTAFSSLAMVTIGYLYQVPLAYFPLCEVTVFAEQAVTERTGLIIRQLTGTIRFDVLSASQIATTSHPRKIIVPSYRQVSAYVNAAIQLFKRQANRDLNGLSGATWAVRQIALGDNVEYGLDSRIQENSYENYGVIPFSVEIQEAKA